jgi:hypothetical protein
LSDLAGLQHKRDELHTPTAMTAQQGVGIACDTSRFEVANIATAVCARGGQRLENVWTTHLIHLMQKTATGTEMRSRDIPDTLGRDLLLHCAEEMRHLAKILPELYKRFGPKTS